MNKLVIQGFDLLHQNKKYVLLAHCDDVVGIARSIANFLYDHGAGILDSAQFNSHQDRQFFVRWEFAGDDQELPPIEALKASFSPIAEKFNMRWDIFDTGAKPKILIAVSKFGHCLNDLLYRWEEGDLPADIVGMARQAMADPDWFIKVRSGHGDEVRLCEYTNYCEGLDQKHKQVTCQLWDRENLDEPDIRKSLDGKRRLVAPSWATKPEQCLIDQRDRHTRDYHNYHHQAFKGRAANSTAQT